MLADPTLIDTSGLQLSIGYLYCRTSAFSIFCLTYERTYFLTTFLIHPEFTGSDDLVNDPVNDPVKLTDSEHKVLHAIEQDSDARLPEELKQRIVQATSAKAAPYVCDLICYYLAHRREDTDWVVLPASNFDNYYCSSYFSKKVLGKIPETILVRQERSGISRYYITEDFLP